MRWAKQCSLTSEEHPHDQLHRLDKLKNQSDVVSVQGLAMAGAEL